MCKGCGRYSTVNNVEYVDEALKALRDFGVVVTSEIQKHLMECATEEEVDRCKRSLIDEHFKRLR